MSKAEIMLTLIMFHSSGYRCLKHYYLQYVCTPSPSVPHLVSSKRLVELEKEVALPMGIFIKKVLLGNCTGINFVDSMPLRVSRNQRVFMLKVFNGKALRLQPASDTRVHSHQVKSFPTQESLDKYAQKTVYQ